MQSDRSPAIYSAVTGLRTIWPTTCRGTAASLKRLIPEPADGRLQLREDLGAALAHLREVRDKYWDHDWRREHRGYGRYPENELWDAVEGYLDLLDASRCSDPDA